MVINCTAEFKVNDITTEALKQFLESIPPNARLSPIMKEIGTQRDPEQKWIGLRAIWQEQRFSEKGSDGDDASTGHRSAG